MESEFVALYVCALIAVGHFTKAQVLLSGDRANIPPNPHKSDPAMGGTISMGTPDLTDEDSMSIHMPKYLNCDACRIISMRFSNAFTKEVEKFPSVKKGKKELSEDRIDDILEEICTDEWTQYGIKEVEGVKRLSGPGFETNDVPGVMQGGGKWPFRFKQMCQIIVGDLGEEVIYHTFRNSNAAGLEKLMCYSAIEGAPGFCEKKPGKPKKKGNTGGKVNTKSEKTKKETKKPPSKHNEL